jgi:hypothetical protein
MRNSLLILFVFYFSRYLSAQHPIGDKLEQLYSQGHYGIVFRKAKKYIQKPETNHLISPKYYLAISSLQRINNFNWFKHNSTTPENSILELNKIKTDIVGFQFLEAHSYELFELKNDLNNWLTELSQRKQKHKVEQYVKLFQAFFNDFNFDVFEIKSSFDQLDLIGASLARQELVKFSKNYLGVPYKWGGSTPEGFDCSGFTQYIMKNKGLQIPRTASDQYEKCRKIDNSIVQCGDLIFFKNENRISHVGMVISKKGEPVKMIHASSSQGISIVEIEKSDYWKKRFYAFGSFLE